jgi:hypothetical protein
MATPRTGRPTGRPPKPKAEVSEKDRGRPAQPLSSHPHGHRIATFKAAEICLSLSERDTAKGLIAAAFGERLPFTLDPINPEHPNRLGLLVRLPKESCRYTDRPPREQFRRYADRLRKLASRYPRPKSDADALWLLAVGQAIVIAHTLGPHSKQMAKQLALSHAAAVGEEEWTKQTLLPWIDSLPTPAETEADLRADLERIARIVADFLSQP